MVSGIGKSSGKSAARLAAPVTILNLQTTSSFEQQRRQFRGLEFSSRRGSHLLPEFCQGIAQSSALPAECASRRTNGTRRKTKSRRKQRPAHASRLILA